MALASDGRRGISVVEKRWTTIGLGVGKRRVRMATRAANTRPHLILPVSERDHIQGPDTAKVTLVEYGDYQCPDCLQAYPIMIDIQEFMGDRMRLVFRNFPLTTMHPNSQHAAEAAEAAGAQGKFWEMHDYLYEHQGSLDDADLLACAKELELE